MPSYDGFTRPGRLFSMATPAVEIQIVATGRDIVIDTQVDVYDVSGHRRRQHATARLDPDAACRLEILLGDAITAALGMPDQRQTALWSNTAVSAQVA